jgi:Tol biopolymer transport system component
VITLSSAGSYNPGGGALTYRWQGSLWYSTNPNPPWSFGDNGVQKVVLTVTNAAGQTATDTAVVTLTNVAPTAVLGVPATVVGQPYTMTIRGMDAGATDTYSLQVALDCGQGAGFTAWSTGSTGSVTCPARARPETLTVRGKVKDKDRDSTVYAQQLVITATPALTGTIAFVSDPDWIPHIYAMNADGSGIRQLTALDGISPYDVVAWSPDGTRLAFEKHAEAFNSLSPAEIYTMNADGSGVTRRTTTPTPFSSANPAWSPDGLKMAFATNRDGSDNWEIYVLTLATGAVQRLTNHADWDMRPSWSPDGTRIAFTRYSPTTGASGIHTIRADGTDIRRLTWTSQAGFGDGSPKWSPDGTRIAFSRMEQLSTGAANVDLYTMNADGTGVVRRTSLPASEDSPAWSPDGNMLVFSTNWDGRYQTSTRQLYVLDLRTGGLTRLTNQLGSNPQGSAGAPSWKR